MGLFARRSTGFRLQRHESIELGLKLGAVPKALVDAAVLLSVGGLAGLGGEPLEVFASYQLVTGVLNTTGQRVCGVLAWRRHTAKVKPRPTRQQKAMD